MHFYLIGYRGAGKSTVGPKLAEALGRPFFDADAVLEANVDRSIADIFAYEGEPAFRQLETLTLETLATGEPAVISTGGGVVLKEANRQTLRRTGFVVWLSASAETLWQRISTDPTTGLRRPNLTASGGLEEVQKLLVAREPLYRETAHVAIDAEAKSPEEAVAAILSEWQSFSNSR